MKIQIRDVTKYIKKTLILDKVTLDFSGGRVYGLQGPNGSGKTMLMRLIAGLIKPSFGEVRIDGKKLGTDIEFPPSMGLLLENPAFLLPYTGLRNLELLASINGIIGINQCRQALLDVGLDPDDKRKYKKYSLGMKQRLGIAAAIMEKPDLILLDEPTNALDDMGVEQVCQLIEREKKRGAVVIISCHDPLVLEKISDEILSVSEGRVERR